MLGALRLFVPFARSGGVTSFPGAASSFFVTLSLPSPSPRSFLRLPAQSGIDISEELLALFEDVKLRHKHKYFVFSLKPTGKVRRAAAAAHEGAEAFCAGGVRGGSLGAGARASFSSRRRAWQQRCQRRLMRAPARSRLGDGCSVADDIFLRSVSPPTPPN